MNKLQISWILSSSSREDVTLYKLISTAKFSRKDERDADAFARSNYIPRLALASFYMRDSWLLTLRFLETIYTKSLMEVENLEGTVWR